MKFNLEFGSLIRSEFVLEMKDRTTGANTKLWSLEISTYRLNLAISFWSVLLEKKEERALELPALWSRLQDPLFLNGCTNLSA